MIQNPLWDVAIPTPLRRVFIYRIPSAIGTPAPGKRVLVPFGPRRITGYLVAPSTPVETGSFRIKEALGMPDDESPFPEELFLFLKEAASYYMHSLGEVLKTALPPGMSHVLANESDEKPPPSKTYTTVQPTPRVATEDAQALLAAMKKRAPARYAAFQMICDGAPMDMSELRRHHRDGTKFVKRLHHEGLVEMTEHLFKPDPFEGKKVERDASPVLTPEQSDAVAAIEARLTTGGYEGFLLHGITGSGKTEVYLRAIDQVITSRRGALVLVPEISLTPQLVERYRARFGDDLVVLHSGLSDQARLEHWKKLRGGHVRVAIGVRSAIFAPVQHLGIIIVDEEHDGSFKQARGFTYNGRDLALLRAARSGAVALLGSATPSLESHHNADTGKLTRLTLKNRATGQILPSISIIDLKNHRSGPGGQTLITAPLHEAITATLEREEQAILFLNRRGFSPAMICGSCAETIRCDACSVAMTFHARPRSLVCHYCGHRRPIPSRCPSCRAEEIKPVGTGTQKAEDILTELFPRATIARMDRDSAGGRKAEALLDRLRRREVDILVGTQMVTKGHDFPHVTLVGVLNADVGLHMPDFRAAERTFQLLTQVAGRAGRADRVGHCFIQTYSANHPAITTARNHDFDTFIGQESAIRGELGYPPFGRVTAIRLSAKSPDAVESASRNLFAALKQIQSRLGTSEVVFLGPAPAPLSQVKERYRWHILLKSSRQDLIRALLEPALATIEAPPTGVRIRIDIDPQSML